MAHDVADFALEVVEKSRTAPVLVDFWAEWCAPCRMLTPILERLADKQADRWTLVTVNTDRHQEIATTYGIRGIPTVKLFVNGAVTAEFTGALPERTVEQWLEKHLPHPHERDLNAAEIMLNREDHAGARAILRGILEHEPDDEKARVLLAGSLLWDDPAAAAECVANIEEHSARFPLVEAIRTIADGVRKAATPETLPDHPVRPVYAAGLAALATRDFDTAVESFIEVIRRHREYEHDGARRGVIAIFRILGDEHPVVQKHRRPFGSALNA